MPGKHSISQVATSRDDAQISDQVVTGLWPLEDFARFMLAERLRADTLAANPIANHDELYSHLLDRALGQVNWFALVDALLDGQPSMASRPCQVRRHAPLAKLNERLIRSILYRRRLLADLDTLELEALDALRETVHDGSATTSRTL